jgi:predicted DNA repair protein MutK
MSGGLLALLDDVVALTKMTATALDGATSQAVDVTSKAAGIVIDDAAVTPRYVVGFAADRELPIIWKITLGSLKNKLVFLLPGALALSELAPSLIPPLLIAGGTFLCFEGAEKAHHLLRPAHASADASEIEVADAATLEAEKVQGAIRTDLILSGEIMAISLASVEAPDLLTRTLILTLVALVVTFGVYGFVGLLVKADDVGLALAQADSPVRGWLGLRTTTGPPHALDRAVAPFTRSFGRALVRGMPKLLGSLSVVGTAAMLWVGGGIVVHALAQLGVDGPEHAIHAAAEAVGHAAPVVSGPLSWLVTALTSAVLGLVLGATVVGVLTVARRATGGDTH